MITLSVSFVNLVLVTAAVTCGGLLFGVIAGIMYAKHEYSAYTVKFKEKLNKEQKEHEEKIKELQKQDAETIKKMQDNFKKYVGEAMLKQTPTPPTEHFN